MPDGTLLALDFGLRWTGVAVGDRASGLAHPLTVIEARSDASRIAGVAKLVDEWQPEGFVIGLPTGAEGKEHPLAPAVRAFAQSLAEKFRLSVAYVDETLTSADAQGALRDLGRGGRAGKNLVHQLSAQRILQDYFDDPSARR